MTSSLALLGGMKLEAQTTPGPQPNICTRACWAARAPNCALTTSAALTRAIVHHTAAASDWDTSSLGTSQAKIRSVQNYHMDAQGWCDIGYNFLFDKLGNIFEGRANSMTTLRRGIHDACNANSFGFTLLGYFHPPYNHVPTQVMLDSYYATIAWRMPAGWSPYGSGTYCSKTVGFLDGHKKVVATACPGDNVHPNLITENYNGGPMRTGVAARRGGAPAAVSRWYFDGGTDGWVPVNGTTGLGWSGSGWPGIIYADQNGPDAYWHSPGTSFGAAAEYSVNVDVYPQSGSSANHDMQIFWKTAQDNTWTSGKSTPVVNYVQQNNWSRINLDVGQWSGTINQLRLDFDQASTGTRWIVNHVYTQKTPKYWFGSSASGWAPGNGLSPIVWTASGWPGVIYADQTANDAYLMGPADQDFLGGINDVVRIRVFPQNGTTPNHDIKVYWTTEASGISEANSSAIVNYSAKDAWADLTIPVGHIPEWNGHFIKQLRVDFDAINQGNRWIVDYIAISHLTTPAAAPVNVADIIVDTAAATAVGAWSVGTSATDKFGADYKFRGQGTGANYLQFTPTIVTAGNYAVYEWHPQGSNRPTDAPHKVVYNGGTQTVPVNQQVGGGAWNLIGTYNFAAGTGGSISITDGFAQAGMVVMADAIKLVHVP